MDPFTKCDYSAYNSRKYTEASVRRRR